MKKRYPDVTAEQLRNYSDTICIICREEMAIPEGAAGADQGGQIKRLPCDHIFHKSCLRSWFQRQQTCPTCRTSILRYNPTPGAGAAQQQAHQHQPAPQQPQAQNNAHQNQAQVPGFNQHPQQPASSNQQTTFRGASNVSPQAAGATSSQLPSFANLFSQMPPSGPPHSFLNGVSSPQFCLPPFGKKKLALKKKCEYSNIFKQFSKHLCHHHFLHLT